MNSLTTKAAMPPALQKMLVGDRFFDGTDMRETGRWQPVPIPDGLRPAAARIHANMDRDLTPAQPDWIAARVLTLLNHFYTPDMRGGDQESASRVWEAVAGDWIAVLRKYPRVAIETACLEYLATATRVRPTPGEIKSLAHKVCGAAMETRDRLERCLNFKPALPSPVRRGGTVTMADALAAGAKAKEILSHD